MQKDWIAVYAVLIALALVVGGGIAVKAVVLAECRFGHTWRYCFHLIVS